MSFNQLFPEVLAAYVADKDCVLTNSQCNELSKYVERLEREISAAPQPVRIRPEDMVMVKYKNNPDTVILRLDVIMDMAGALEIEYISPIHPFRRRAKMTDFDALIDDYVQSELEYIDNEGEDWKIARDNARSALREAIAALETELAEADADAERLDKWEVEYDGKYYCHFCQKSGHDADCPHVLHVARLSKRGQG